MEREKGIDERNSIFCPQEQRIRFLKKAKVKSNWYYNT